jgi:hypothetical protein
MKRISRDELLRALHAEQAHVQALQCLVRDLPYRAGWRFVHTPRGMGAYLVHVDVDGYATHYDESIGSEERRKRDVVLYELAKSESDDELMGLLEAFKDRDAFFAKMRGAA